MVEDILNKKIAAAIRTEKDFSKALKSRVDVVFLLHSNIITVNQSVKEIHGAGKKAFVHLDFAEGIGKDRAGIEFLAKNGVDGILTNPKKNRRQGHEYQMAKVQILFIFESQKKNT